MIIQITLSSAIILQPADPLLASLLGDNNNKALLYVQS